MSRLRSLNSTLASERMGISTKGLLPPLVALRTDSASFSIFWMVFLSIASSLAMAYSCSSSPCSAFGLARESAEPPRSLRAAAW